MKNQVLRQDRLCRVCLSNRIVTVIKFKDTPLEDQFVKKEQKNIEQPTYPLELAICEDCGYVHLPYIVSPEVSYEEYIYVSGVTVGLRDHYDEYAREIVSTYSISQKSLVVDLGSNDGSMLASFKKVGMNVVGVEPARTISIQANQSGIPTINDFFTENVVLKIVQDHGLASVVTANYMYANIDDIISFTKSVSKLLKREGIFVVQTGYHPEQMKIKMFDYIYHEHFSYFTVEVLKDIFLRCGLELVQVTKTLPKGGSVRAIGQLKGGSLPIDSSVTTLIEEEHRLGMRDKSVYRKFDLELEILKKQVIEKLTEFKSLGKRIVGIGASHSTTTLTYHFELRPFLEYLVDDNQLKHGLYSPGYHIPVYPSEKLYEDKPDIVVVLAWQHQESIIKKHKTFLNSGGKFFIPLPILQVLGSE
ncbi:C-methyltransferase C-terminal domain protein [Leptospira interrogans str. 2003000735]|uniref:C-methyltransferase C-terminal domain protein n=3 Tax=Leptospira interrogans TaxID=173 RepID=A0A829CX67_LEPIR|nr:class I SAM-dependent methyltransferase [Leptospira interrogans]EMY02637.1 C-methyltransferase C-terminal domain protein [Leptospira interrogans str. 2002000626]EMY26907.1 C-methyltransferase C-terminal domain protein [Leptospira interrogans serovar Australis str. 200703203]AKH77639.1 methyltransferase [Leptospira interrogans serovar Bratislava]EKN90284.1 C-methyltransferase C-terminal domain protein [Leptospira interrogans str. 2002000624]EKQ36040.1 C-methyltransferase C-terminal domain pr